MGAVECAVVCLVGMAVLVAALAAYVALQCLFPILSPLQGADYGQMQSMASKGTRTPFSAHVYDIINKLTPPAL